jgi:hypothetical protein
VIVAQKGSATSRRGDHAKPETTTLCPRVAVNTIRDITSPLQWLGLNLEGRSPPAFTRPAGRRGLRNAKPTA